jgi:DNA-binding GntR family transcriptional regulator
MTRRSTGIASVLEKEILSNAFAIGEVINEVATAERFGVSRTPVREALLSLAGIGLVRLEPGRGAVVVGMSPQKIFESYEVLAELQGMAASLATRRMTAMGRAKLLALHEDMRSCMSDDKRTEYMELDTQFHDSILEACSNAVLTQQVADCERTIAAVRHASMEAHASLQDMYQEHDCIVAALTSGNPDAARKAMHDHVQLRGDVASKLVVLWREQNMDSIPL